MLQEMEMKIIVGILSKLVGIVELLLNNLEYYFLYVVDVFVYLYLIIFDLVYIYCTLFVIFMDFLYSFQVFVENLYVNNQ